MTDLHIAYISLSGNVHNFVGRLVERLYPLTVTTHDIKQLIKEGQPFYMLDKPTIVVVPTYLDGGDGINNGTTEILTTPLREFIAANSNDKHVIGIVGSGNKNFNNQYCLTAKQYAMQFNAPVIGDFEMRGLDADVDRIAKKIKELLQI